MNVEAVRLKLGLTPTEFARELGVSKGYAGDLRSGRRDPSPKVAIRIYRAAKIKLGPIAHASDAEIDVLERFEAA